MPGTANITTQAGDRAIFVRRGAAAAAQWLCLSYQRADGRAVVAPPPIKYARLVHELAQGTAGPSYAAGSWLTIPLNTKESDVDGIVTLSGNNFSLDPGDYYLTGIFSVWSAGAVSPVARLYNVTAGAEVERGATDGNQANVAMKGFNGHEFFLRLAVRTTFRFEIYCRGAATNPATNTAGFSERFNIVHIRKYA